MTDAASLTYALGGRWYRRYGAAPCPVCQQQVGKARNARTLADGREGQLLAHCKESGCDFCDIRSAAGVEPGAYQPPNSAILAQRDAKERMHAEMRTAQAEQLWQETTPITGTAAEKYLRGRAITCLLPDTLRFAPSCWHVSTQRLPAMVARIEEATRFALHRTYLCPDGSGKAPVDPVKAMLGAVRGRAVRLCNGPGPLVVAEGVETALSLASGLLDAPATIWAALSTSGMRSLHLPDKPGRLTIAPDGDAAGQTAACTLAERARALEGRPGQDTSGRQTRQRRQTNLSRSRSGSPWAGTAAARIT